MQLRWRELQDSRVQQTWKGWPHCSHMHQLLAGSVPWMQHGWLWQPDGPQSLHPPPPACKAVCVDHILHVAKLAYESCPYAACMAHSV